MSVFEITTLFILTIIIFLMLRLMRQLKTIKGEVDLTNNYFILLVDRLKALAEKRNVRINKKV